MRRVILYSLLVLVFAGGAPDNNASFEITLPFTPIYKMISAQGNMLGVVSKKINIHLIALPSGREVRKLDVHNAIKGAFSPDGKWLAVATRDSNVVVYSTTSNAQKSWKLKDYPWTMSFLRNDWLLINHTLWNVNNAKSVMTLKTDFGEVNVVALSPDGKKAAAGGGDTRVRLYTPGSGKRSLQEWKLTHQYNGLKLEVLGLAFTPDGSRVAAGGLDGRITLLDATTGKVVKTVQTGMTGIASIDHVGKSPWMLVRYINARTNKQKACRLVNINTGKSHPLRVENSIVRVTSSGKIWAYSFKSDTMIARREVIPKE
ncbi:MAG TPA: hypothetical protein VE870_03555 [Bacteroidales bacterium]|nr:hypothetical protein [Bacteroidales bacterium]